MNPENQDFESLRRLLKLKRYEQPPPRYFNDFSSQVINRIRANHPEDRVQTLEPLSWEAPWLQRFLGIFERKPIIAGVFGAAVCAVLVGGAVYSEKVAVPVGGAADLAGTQLQAPASPLPAVFTSGSSLGLVSSTNAISAFDLIQRRGVQQANYAPFGQ